MSIRQQSARSRNHHSYYESDAEGSEDAFKVEERSSASEVDQETSAEESESSDDDEEDATRPSSKTSQRNEVEFQISSAHKKNVVSNFIELYKQEAFDLLISEVGKYPDFYSLALFGIKHFTHLKGITKASWHKIVSSLRVVAPDICEELTWETWRSIRLRYRYRSCPRLIKNKIPYLNELEKGKGSRIKPLASYGDDAVILFLNEVQNYPQFYRHTVAKVYSADKLRTEEAKQIWKKILAVMRENYPGVKEQAVWSCWRTCRRNYRNPNDVKVGRFKEHLRFLHKMTEMKKLERTEQPNNKTAIHHQSLRLKYGLGALDLMLQEIGKYPEVYTVYMPSMVFVDDLPEDGQKAFRKVLSVMRETYKDVPEDMAWKTWRKFREKYHTKNCPKRYIGKVKYLDEWRTKRTITNEISTVHYNLHTYEAEEIEKIGTELLKNRSSFVSTMDSFMLNNSRRAALHLIKGVSKHRDFYYLRLANHTTPDTLKKDSKELWTMIVEELKKKFPSVDDLEAYKAWRSLRMGYHMSQCPKNWRGKAPFLDEFNPNPRGVSRTKRRKTDNLSTSESENEEICSTSSEGDRPPKAKKRKIVKSSKYRKRKMEYSDSEDDDQGKSDYIIDESVDYDSGELHPADKDNTDEPDDNTDEPDGGLNFHTLAHERYDFETKLRNYWNGIHVSEEACVALRRRILTIIHNLYDLIGE
ncbi:hypothetical protein QR680_019333 [Steinernema hermaphroditum]|uniref:MADF domain-containing protein n=1 Tax=Steinernema hermaphroditum TaxID=289476 RepID=A0AA39GNR3_9BILA|nr:hypothetical protein QR680_019333 [Steinernema hermaphroditum]